MFDPEDILDADDVDPFDLDKEDEDPELEDDFLFDDETEDEDLALLRHDEAERDPYTGHRYEDYWG